MGGRGVGEIGGARQQLIPGEGVCGGQPDFLVSTSCKDQCRGLENSNDHAILQ